MMGLQLKLTIPIFISLMFFASVIHFYWGPKQYEAKKFEISEQLDREMSALDNSLIRGLLENDYAALYSSLKVQEITNKGKWHHLTLFNDNGKKIYPLFPEDNNSELKESNIPYSHPIVLEGKTLGVIKLDADWQDEYKKAKQQIYNLEAYLFGITCLLILFISFWQYKIIIRPIQYLQNAVNIMINGNFNDPLPVISHDEIGQLAIAFNQMRKAIDSSQQQLKKSHSETLEAFDELARKNIELHDEIGKRIKIQERLSRIVTHDELTSLPNLYLLKQETTKAISDATGSNENTGIIYIALKEFTKIIETHGQKTGDIVLVETSIRMADEIRNIDTIGRVGNDEFVIVLPDCDSLSKLKDMAQRILDQIKLPVESIKIPETISASIGVSMFPENGSDFDTLLNKAKVAINQTNNSAKGHIYSYQEKSQI